MVIVTFSRLVVTDLLNSIVAFNIIYCEYAATVHSTNSPAYEPLLYEYIGGIIKGTGGISLSINGAEDHVHVLTKLRPDRALSDVLRDLKCNARLDA